jgi:hypothetical protein
VLETSSDALSPTRSYRAITRHTDGRIIHVRDIRASSDAEAIRIVTERGADIRTDLWSEDGLVQRFGVRTM